MVVTIVIFYKGKQD